MENQNSNQEMKCGQESEGKPFHNTSDALFDMLDVCFNMLNTYNKKYEDLNKIHSGFMFLLKEYESGDIINAFAVHLKRSPNFPTPSDIVSIIDPPEQALDKSMYISCKQWLKENASAPFSLKERDCIAYVKAYEGRESKIIQSEKEPDIAIADSRATGLINNLTKGMR